MEARRAALELVLSALVDRTAVMFARVGAPAARRDPGRTVGREAGPWASAAGGGLLLPQQCAHGAPHLVERPRSPVRRRHVELRGQCRLVGSRAVAPAHAFAKPLLGPPDRFGIGRDAGVRRNAPRARQGIDRGNEPGLVLAFGRHDSQDRVQRNGLAIQQVRAGGQHAQHPQRPVRHVVREKRQGLGSPRTCCRNSNVNFGPIVLGSTRFVPGTTLER